MWLIGTVVYTADPILH